MDKMIEDVKRDLMAQVILNMRHTRLSLSSAEDLAQDFLAIFPVVDVEELFNKLFVLTRDYKEVRKVFLKYAQPYFEEKRKFTLALMRKYVDKNEIENALSVAKGGKHA